MKLTGRTSVLALSVDLKVKKQVTGLTEHTRHQVLTNELEIQQEVYGKKFKKTL